MVPAPAPAPGLVGVAGEVRVGAVGVGVQRDVQHVGRGRRRAAGCRCRGGSRRRARRPARRRRRRARLGGDGGVVEVAVAAVDGAGGVVAGRPAQRVGDGLARRARRRAPVRATSTDQPGGGVGALDERRGGVEHPRAEGGDGAASGAGAGPMPSRSAGCRNVSGTTSTRALGLADGPAAHASAEVGRRGRRRARRRIGSRPWLGRARRT